MKLKSKIGPHDLGGDAAGTVPKTAHELLWWEKRIDALFKLLSDDKRQLLKVDELRFAIESLGDDAYSRYGYYERWTLAIQKLLVDKQVLSGEEIMARVQQLKSSE